MYHVLVATSHLAPSARAESFSAKGQLITMRPAELPPVAKL